MLKRFVRTTAGSAARLGSRLRFALREETTLTLPSSGRLPQIALALQYRNLIRTGSPLPALSDVGFRVYSQADEDGILHFLFTLLGPSGGGRAVEIGCGSGIECNTANLIVNHGWDALLIDADAGRVDRARRAYGTHPDTWVHPPRIVQALVTPETADVLLVEHAFNGEIDLLSLDIDSTDYWVWEGLQAAAPRVVVVEYNNMWPGDRCVTLPREADPDLARDPDYYGASLGAFVKLGRTKGYRLVGCNRFGFNAFFVRRGLADDLLPEVPPAACLATPFARHRQQTALPRADAAKWTEV
jgi:hypothetical protein